METRNEVGTNNSRTKREKKIVQEGENVNRAEIGRFNFATNWVECFVLFISAGKETAKTFSNKSARCLPINKSPTVRS